MNIQSKSQIENLNKTAQDAYLNNYAVEENKMKFKKIKELMGKDHKNLSYSNSENYLKKYLEWDRNIKPKKQQHVRFPLI